MDNKLCAVINLLILMYVGVPVQSFLTDIERSSQRLDELLIGVDALRYSRDSERDIEIWQEYEFETGVGNREELFIVNITTKIDPALSESTDNYQLVESEGEFFLASSTAYMFSLYKLDLLTDKTIYRINLNSERRILTFKLLSLPNISQPDANSDMMIVAILCVESAHGTDLRWYRYTGKELVPFWSWPVEKRVEHIQFFHHEKQNRLLLLREANIYIEQLYSPIDIYGFELDGERPSLWLSQRLTVPKTFDIQVCPTYESTVMALQRRNDVVLYEYKGDRNKEGLFREHQNVTSNALHNIICFENGYIPYLVTSGPETALFEFLEGEFQHNSDFDDVFNNVGDVSWIQSIPVNTYREESIILVQLQNSTIIALSWKGHGFEKIPQSEFNFGRFDLSKITVIPKYGFVYGNKLVKIDTKLREKSRPVRDEMEKLLQTRKTLAEVLRKQELILDETEVRINQSYLMNPDVTGIWNLTDVEAESVIIEDEVFYDDISIGTKTMDSSEFFSDFEKVNNILNEMDSNLVEIKSNLATALPINSSGVALTGDLIINGGFRVQETLSANNVTFEHLNDIPITEILEDLYNYDDNLIIEGEKTFEAIDANYLNVAFINGEPISDVIFSSKKSNYSNIDFSQLTKLYIDGNLNFSYVHGRIWENLVKNVVMKSHPMNIPGVTIVEGDLVARNIQIDQLNGLRYPEDYVLTNSTDTIEFTEKKTFSELTVGTLEPGGLKTINGVPIEKYVTLNGDRTLTEDISFENLIITDVLQIDGKITGLPENQKGPGLMLNETSEVTSDVVFAKLIVLGDLEVENSINGIEWSELDDLVSKKDLLVEITGEKIFLKEVEVGADMIIESQRINGYPIQEFVTHDTEQVFPNLEKISGNVTFNVVTRGDLESLTKILIQNIDKSGQPQCLKESVFFRTPPIVEYLFLNEVNGNSADDFSGGLNKTLSSLQFENLEVITLRAHQISPVNFRIIQNHIKSEPFDPFRSNAIPNNIKNLEKISGNVTFNVVTRGDLESLTKILIQNIDKSGQPQCLKESVFFRTPPIVEYLFLNEVNGNSADDFSGGLNKTLSSLQFENLEVITLRAHQISPVNLNGLDFEKLEQRIISKTKPQTLIGDYEIEVLETKLLNTQTVDGFSVERLEKLRFSLDDIYKGIVNGSLSIDTLTVRGMIKTTNINGEPFQNIYEANKMGTVIFPKDVYVENLTVLGFVNGINFTDFVNDAVFKTDTNIDFTGHKTFDTINCHFLDIAKINGKNIDHILDPNKHQILSGSMKVNGMVRILDHFKTQGKIGGVPWQTIQQRFQYLGNNTYSLTGDLRFTSEEIFVDNLIVTDSIQNIRFNDFLDTVIYKDSKNITIYGPVIFKDSVTIDGPFVINERFNDLDLKYFYDNAIRIDKPFAIKSTVVFTEDISIEEDLIVDNKLEANTIGGIDLNELYDDAAYSDRPTFISGSVKLENVVFESNIEVETLNDMDLRAMITLHEEQTLPGTLHCMDIAVGNLDIAGTFNRHDLGAIYDDTFQLSGNQNISGHIVVIGNVLMRHSFDSTLINDVNPAEFISLNGNETLIGNFVFEKPLVLHGNFVAVGPINDIDISMWQAAAVTKVFPFKQIIKGSWTIHGNVYFEKDVFGSDLLDDVNVTKLVDDLHRHNVETELVMEDVKSDLQSICEDLAILKKGAEKQIYKYKYFDYLQVLNFDRPIVSLHHFESDDFDYLLVNFDTCYLDIFVFTGTEFTAITSISKIGLIERWFTLYFEEETYFLTVGKYSCDKSAGNLWKLSNDQFIHVHDLGNVTDAKIINENEFLLVVDGVLLHRSILEIYQESLSKPKSYIIGSKNVKFVSDSQQVLLLNRDHVYEYQLVNNTGLDLKNCFGTDSIASFRVGIYQREIFVYYDENLSEDYLFISDNKLVHHKIHQTIRAQQPSSPLVMNFDNFVENFLIFIENRKRLQIYEYRGIEGFVYRETINMNAERIFKFKLRKYSKLAKQHCIAAIEGQRLVIMEAKMYGKKLDMGSLSCEN